MFEGAAVVSLKIKTTSTINVLRKSSKSQFRESICFRGRNVVSWNTKYVRSLVAIHEGLSFQLCYDWLCLQKSQKCVFLNGKNCFKTKHNITN